MSDLGPVILPDCREENYVPLLGKLNEPGNLAATWEGFRSALDISEQSFRAQGRVVKRVYIEPEAFARWCDINSRSANHAAMYRFAFGILRGRMTPQGTRLSEKQGPVGVSGRAVLLKTKGVHVWCCWFCADSSTAVDATITPPL